MTAADFQGTMATEHKKNFDEHSRRGAADYKGDNLLVQLTESDGTRTRESCVNSVLLLPVGLLQSEDEWATLCGSMSLWRWRSLGCCCSTATVVSQLQRRHSDVRWTQLRLAPPVMGWARTPGFFLYRKKLDFKSHRRKWQSAQHRSCLSWGTILTSPSHSPVAVPTTTLAHGRGREAVCQWEEW